MSSAIIGAAVGGIASGLLSGKGGGGGTTEINNEPWTGVQPYLLNLYGQAGDLMNQPAAYYPYQTFAGPSPLTGAGWEAALNYLGNAYPGYMNTGNQALMSMLSAPDVANNPYVNQMLAAQSGLVGDALKNQWLPAIASGSGLAGQGYHQTRTGLAQGQAIGEAGKALSNAAAQTQLGAYGEGLKQQALGAAFLPQLMELGMLPSTLLGQVGAQQEGYKNQEIMDAVNRFNFYQQEPRDRLTWANSIYSGIPWSQEQTQNLQSNPWLTGIGTGMSLYGFGQETGLWDKINGMFGTNNSAPMTNYGGGAWGDPGSSYTYQFPTNWLG